MRNTMLVAALAIAGGLCLFVAPGSAAPVALGIPPAIEKPAAANIELVAKRYYAKRRWSYNARHHGTRYRYRHGRYIYKYGPWYYPRPWWYAPGIAVGIGAAYGAYSGYYDGDYYDGGYGYDEGYGDEGYAAHVQWCLDRYRSYDPRTDSFLGYDGYRHRCNSPLY